jgi:hypothetical protein
MLPAERSPAFASVISRSRFSLSRQSQGPLPAVVSLSVAELSHRPPGPGNRINRAGRLRLAPGARPRSYIHGQRLREPGKVHGDVFAPPGCWCSGIQKAHQGALSAGYGAWRMAVLFPGGALVGHGDDSDWTRGGAKLLRGARARLLPGHRGSSTARPLCTLEEQTRGSTAFH